MLACLQVTQARRIGRGDINSDVIRQGRKLKRALVIVTLRVRAVFILSDIDAKDQGSRSVEPVQVSEHRLLAVIIETHAVEDGLARLVAKESWPWITPLREGGNGSHFDEAETEPVEGCGRASVFIQTGGKAKGMRKGHTHDRLR